MKIGDIVARKSYNCDIWFKISDILEDTIILTGVYYRLIADANLNDIVSVSTRSDDDEDRDSNKTSSNLFQKWYKNQYSFESNLNDNSSQIYKRVGKVMHIDGDKSYLKECLAKYEKLGVPVIGINIEESLQPQKILELLKLYRPNILVITGHDSLVKDNLNSTNIQDYKNSKYYEECIKIAREYNSNYDDLVIFAGGCKSNYEALMKAGANFASSPNRILIHVTDPVIVACKVATTSIREILDIDSIVKNTFAGLNGIGGIETRGQCREGKPSF